jgi:hypothetical protein
LNGQRRRALPHNYFDPFLFDLDFRNIALGDDLQEVPQLCKIHAGFKST